VPDAPFGGSPVKSVTSAAARMLGRQGSRRAGMGDTADLERVRLAELVGALPLSIDLGFGQPMEHVGRQRWIALHLAEQLGLDQDQRAVVYYTALLTNVTCPTDARIVADVQVGCRRNIGSCPQLRCAGRRGAPCRREPLVRVVCWPTTSAMSSRGTPDVVDRSDTALWRSPLGNQWPSPTAVQIALTSRLTLLGS
jgi:hypothetical protein